MIVNNLAKKQIEFMVGGALIGGLLQILTTLYLKKHPELLDKHKPDTIPESGKPHFWKIVGKLRGGVSITGIALGIRVVATFSNYGTLIGLGAGAAVFLKNLKRDELFNFLYSASPQNLPLTGLIATESLDLCLGICTDNLKYLFAVLSDESIPFKEREETAYKILTNYIDLKTYSGQLVFVLCLVLLLSTLYYLNFSGYLALLRQLLRAMREGKIRKALIRVIIRKLLKEGIKIDPELVEAAK